MLLENDTPPKTYIHVKGDWRDRGAEVQPGTLAVLPPMPAGESGRLGLAHWLVSPDHPLTSRVAVNRIWQEVFGRGIVFTSEDFGTQGDRPTHPGIARLAGQRIHAARLEHEADGAPAGDLVHLPAVFSTRGPNWRRKIRRTRCWRANRVCACPRN